MGRDTITGLAVIAVSLVLFWATLGLERHPMVPIGPAFYPRIVLGITVLMALALVVTDLLARRRRVVAVAQAAVRPNYALVLVCFAIFAVYVVAMPYLGFRVSSLLFLLVMPVAMERPASRARWIALIVTAAVATAGSHYIFEHYLHVLLPRGLWTGF
jgi:putative tricarboxylic transport membrane protein